MSSVPPSAPPSEPSFDLAYSLEGYEDSPHRDNTYLVRRLEQAMLNEGAAGRGRTLDVACGVANLVAGISARGSQGWGVEPSPEMLGIARLLHSSGDAVLVRGVAEVLPFRDGSFDRLICQGALDHFVDPHAFMREAGRCVRPGRSVIIARKLRESVLPAGPAATIGRRRRLTALDALAVALLGASG